MIKSTRIPLQLIELEDSSFHIMIEARFKRTKGNLIIDTGASKTVLDYTFGKKIASSVKKIKEQNSSGINAMITDSHLAIIPSLVVGRLKIENYSCVLLDLSHVNALYQKYCDKSIAGLIGSDFLVLYQAIIDYEKKSMKLTLPDTKVLTK
ncbi:MAG: hypothetical protein CVU09_12945 [Bacteroidetes bacterium HGW-Bacteroidetes-4]|jgi:hypothetical protein|nr:MAG: hypothetical protein CVU09_12945 [Bacteroidetes bacterium HGW-Bacteroidetes-4]